jgi:hypothetical protein
LHEIVIGPLRIAALEAGDDVDVARSGQVTDRPRVQLTGVTVAGQAAAIDQDGVHVLGVHQSASAPALSQQGIDVRLLGGTRSDATGAARSTAGGLRVSFTAPVRGVPAVVPGAPGANRSYLGSVLVGGVGAAVAVGSPGGALLSVLPPAAPTSLAARLLPARSLPAGQPSAALVTGVGDPSVATAPAAARRHAALPQPDLAVLALALALVPTGLLAAWRLGVAVNRRRA